MIKIEHIITPSPEMMEFVIEGMRNPLDSWEESDSYFCQDDPICPVWIGPKDEKLMRKLCQAGSDERKFMRQMPLAMRITAPLYWWKEFDTYKVGTVANSCSTMHKIAAKPFDISQFSTEHFISDVGVDIDVPGTDHDGSDSYEILDMTIQVLNGYRDLYLSCPPELAPEKKEYWWQLIQLLPTSYNQTRNVTLNYEVARNMYFARRNHKLNEWRELCKVFETLSCSFLITEEKPMDIYKEPYGQQSIEEYMENLDKSKIWNDILSKSKY